MQLVKRVAICSHFTRLIADVVRDFWHSDPRA